MEQNHPHTALLVLDMQEGIMSSFPESEKLTVKIADAIDVARTRRMPVIYSVVGFRTGAPEIGGQNKFFAAAKDRLANADAATMMRIHDTLKPQDGDITVIKKRFSAFTGSDLEVVLRALDIKHLVLTGISTSGVILSTVREAADKDYSLTVLADCCADRDEEVHDLLMRKIFPRQADVMNVEDWVE